MDGDVWAVSPGFVETKRKWASICGVAAGDRRARKEDRADGGLREMAELDLVETDAVVLAMRGAASGDDGLPPVV